MQLGFCVAVSRPEADNIKPDSSLLKSDLADLIRITGIAIWALSMTSNFTFISIIDLGVANDPVERQRTVIELRHVLLNGVSATSIAEHSPSLRLSWRMIG